MGSNGKGGATKLLLPQHEAMIVASAISPEIRDARGYRSVTRKVDLRNLGFATRQQNVPALLLPLWNARGEVCGYQIRPDTPRVGAEGRVIKYEQPQGTSMVLDVPPTEDNQRWVRDPAIPLIITEGVKKADAVVAAGGCCVAMLGVYGWRGTNEFGGRTNFPDWGDLALNDRRPVVIAFDSDVMLNPQVYRALVGLSAFLEHRGAEVQVVYLPHGPGGSKQGVDDFLAAGHSLAAFLDLRTSTLREPPREAVDPAALPLVPVNDCHRRVITSAYAERIRVLNDQAAPILYRRGRMMVQVVSESPAVAEEVGPGELAGILDRIADAVKVTEKGTYPARPPQDVVTDLLTLKGLGLPKLEDVRRTPVFLPGGRLLDTPGYDRDSGIFLDPHGLGPPVARMKVETALSWLREELLVNFPFVDDGSRAHALALLLQPFVRPLITGPTPLFLIDAPAQGTGKGLLAEVAGRVALGENPAAMALSGSDEELDKRITSLLLAAVPWILIDNIEALVSPTLAAMLTSEYWEGRILGHSRMVRLPNQSTWVVTGNNVSLSIEHVRRAIPIRLDAGIAHPENRTNFKHARLSEWVMAHRPQLVAACLSLVLAWKDDGMKLSTRTLGRYEVWAGVLGGILEHAEVPGFLTGRDRLNTTADTETDEWTQFCSVWYEQFGEKPQTVGILSQLIRERQMLLSVWVGQGGLAALQRIGRALTSRRDRVFGDYVIRLGAPDRVTKSNTYYVEPREQPEPPPPALAPPPDQDTHTHTAPGEESETTPANPPKPPQTPPPGTKTGVLGAGVSRGFEKTTPSPETGGCVPGEALCGGLRGFGGFISDSPPIDARACVSAEAPLPLAAWVIPPAEGDPFPVEAVYLRDTADLEAVIQAVTAANTVAIDFETTGLCPQRDRPRLLSIATEATRSYVLDLFSLDADVVREQILSLLVQKRLVGHNLGFELRYLTALGVDPEAFTQPLVCTLVRDQIVTTSATRPTHVKRWADPQFQGKQHGLEHLARRYLGIPVPKGQRKTDWGADVLTEKQIAYAGKDAAVLLPMVSIQEAEIEKEHHQDTLALENDCLLPMLWVANSGVPLNLAVWEAMEDEKVAELQEVEAALQSLAPPPPEGQAAWNWGSWQQVLKVFELVGVPLPNTKKETLADLIHPQGTPLAALVIRQRSLTSRINTYGREAMAEWGIVDGRLYASWRQLGAVTGRMSCSEPNLQNIPKKDAYRRGIEAPPGRVLVKGDFATLELRIAALYAGDEELLQAFRDDADLHRLTASRIYGKELAEVTTEERQLGKTLNFGLLYGAGAATFRRGVVVQGGEMTLEEAEHYRAAWFEAYPLFYEWQQTYGGNQIRDTLTLAGRRRRDVLKFTERLNSPIQGSGADGLKRALVLLYQSRHQFPGVLPIILCHDEVVLECDDDPDQILAVSAWLKESMEAGMQSLDPRLPVRVDVSHGKTWAG